jgi:hypothetical protein
VPATLRDAVLARAAPLSAAARALLDAVAIVHQRAEMWLLDSLTESPPRTLEECLRSGILSADAASVAFRHELARLAAEDSLAPDWWLELHRRVTAEAAIWSAGSSSGKGGVCRELGDAAEVVPCGTLIGLEPASGGSCSVRLQ